MAAKEELLRTFSEERKELQTKAPDILKEWQQSLTVLYRQIAGWLAESVAENLLRVEEIPVEVNEERLGAYLASSLKIITPRGESVYIVPRARIVVGAYGRVDLECSPKRVMLVRKEPERWQFTQLDPGRGGWSFKDLSEDSFWESLQYLLS